MYCGHTSLNLYFLVVRGEFSWEESPEKDWTIKANTW